MASESIAHSAFSLMGYWLRAHLGWGIIVKYHICFPQEVQDEAGSDKGAIDGGSENEFEAREFSKFVFLLAEIDNSDGPYLFKSWLKFKLGVKYST